MRSFSLRLALALLFLAWAGSLLAPFVAPYPPERQFREDVARPPGTIRMWDWRSECFWPCVIVSDPFDGPEEPDGIRISRIRLLVEGHPYRLFGFPLRLRLFGTADPEVRVFLLGTDSLGRDIFSRLLHGMRFSLSAGVAAILLTAVVGVFAGAFSGYVGGAVDRLTMRVCDLFLSLPNLFLILGIRALFPLDLTGGRVFWVMVLVFSLVGWGSVARMIRGQVLTVKHREHVLAARVMGASHGRILLRHILPLTLNALLVQVTFLLPLFIVGEVTLSFLGVGVQEPGVSLGTLLNSGATLQAILERRWELAPAAVFFGIVLCFNLAADELRTLGRARAQWW
jgi:peptide/nickel transport system permease protein